MISWKTIANWLLPPIASIVACIWMAAHWDAKIDNHETRITHVELAQAEQSKSINDMNVTLGRIDERVELLLKYFGQTKGLKP